MNYDVLKLENQRDCEKIQTIFERNRTDLYAVYCYDGALGKEKYEC